jgi:hypothetical protein
MKPTSRTVAAIACFSFLAGATVLVGGCTSTTRTPQGATATYNSVTGNLSTTVESNLDRTWDAAVAAVNDMQYRIVDRNKDAMTGIINAKTADGSNVRVKADRQSDHVTGVTVGMGPMGKEATARTLMDKILSRLR